MLIKLSSLVSIAYLPLWIVLAANPTNPIPQLTAYQIIIWGSSVSVVGGIAAALRSEHHWYDFIRVAVNTGVIGGGICAFSLRWTMNDPALGFMLLGAVCVMSLGGLMFVEYLLNLLPILIRQTLVRWGFLDEEQDSNDDSQDDSGLEQDDIV